MQLSENSGEKKLSLVVQVSELREWGIEEDQDLGFLKSFLGSVQRKLLPNDPHLISAKDTRKMSLKGSAGHLLGFSSYICNLFHDDGNG